jgi:uncharacterized protein YkwD
VLVALFVGATTAGTATVLAKPLDSITGEQAGFATSFTYARKPPVAAKTVTERPAPPPANNTTSAAPVPTTVATTTSAAPAPTTTPPAPPPPPKPAPPAPGQVDRVVALVNEERADAGCGALTVDGKLNAAASAHSADMADRNYFSHTTPEGVTFDQRIENAGYAAPGGENIAQGQDSADEVMAAWMKSKGHKANILNCQFNTIGVGLATDGWYWTQDFGY